MVLTYEQRKEVMLKVKLRSRRPGRKPGSKWHRGKITCADLLQAIEAVGPYQTRMAKFLGSCYHTIHAALFRPANAEALKAYEACLEGQVDDAEDAITQCIKQNDDLSVKAGTAKWFLANKVIGAKRGYSDRKTVTLEGNPEKPINIQSTTTLVPVESLPLDLRRQVLESIEANQKKRITLRRRRKS